MAVNKNALVRYKVLDNCFRNPGRRYFIDDLIEECNKALLAINSESGGISRRQIFEDITFMESVEGWGIDLKKERDGRRVFYRYSDLSFSINNMPLNEVEINQLQSALDILSQFKGMPQFEWVHELLPKLQQGVLSEHQSIIHFDSNQYLKGIEHIGTLYNAIRFRRVLRIGYHPFESKVPIEFTIHPYHLRQYNNRWFLFGFNPEKEKYDWNLALDRIVTVDEIKHKYIRNNGINWDEFFEDIIGVTKPLNARLENIQLLFIGPTGKYIESKPIHGSQKSKWLDNNTLEVRLQLIINYEFERLVLSYGESVIVKHPDAFKSKVAMRLRDAASIYN